jgi:hypothetical protein
LAAGIGPRFGVSVERGSEAPLALILFNIIGRRHMWKRMFFGVLGTISLALLGTPASAATVFGSKLNHEPTPAETCKDGKPSDMCSWVMTIAQQNPGKEKAPKNGTIAQLKLRSCTPGSFVLQLALTIPAADKARAVRTGPAINYKGSPKNCNGGNVIETFNVNVPVLAGESLSVIATKVGFIYNASGDGTLVFDPLLADGSGFRTTTGTGLGSGILLLQAIYND